MSDTLFPGLGKPLVFGISVEAVQGAALLSSIMEMRLLDKLTIENSRRFRAARDVQIRKGKLMGRGEHRVWIKQRQQTDVGGAS